MAQSHVPLCRALDPEDIEAISAFAFAEMLEAGFTRVGEFHYLHHDRDGTPYARHRRACGADLLRRRTTAALDSLCCRFSTRTAASATRLRRRLSAVSLRTLSSSPSFARQASAQSKPLEGARVGVAPHSLRAVAPAELAALVSMAPSAPLHLHIAEQLKEVADCIAWCGSRPVDWLLDHAPVDGRWCLVHATHVDAEERIASPRAVRSRGYARSRRRISATEFFPLPSSSGQAVRSRSARIPTSSSVRRRNCARSNIRSVLPSDDAMYSPVMLSTQAVGASLAPQSQAVRRRLAWARRGLHVGADADIVSLDTTDVALTSRRGDALLDSWIFAARGSLIDCVWRRGRKVVSGGCHIRGEAITQRYREVLARLLARL